jgi:uncharacterized protein (TIGR04255 family)
MAGFLPFAGKNSVVEAALGLQFVQPLSPLIGPSFDALQREFIADFPKFEKLQMLQFNLGVAQPAEAHTAMVGGFNATRVRGDGNPSRAFRGANNVISLHFFEYSHWNETKAIGLGLFVRCLKLLGIPSAQNPIVAITLKFVDRFTFDGPADMASASQLLKQETRYVSKEIFDVQIPWHVNTGWSEPLLGEKIGQHQLLVQGAKDLNSFIMVQHNISFSVLPFLTVVEETDGRKEPLLEEIFDAQHQSNVLLLKNMLTDEMCGAIGLGGEGS